MIEIKCVLINEFLFSMLLNFHVYSIIQFTKKKPLLLGLSSLLMWPPARRPRTKVIYIYIYIQTHFYQIRRTNIQWFSIFLDRVAEGK